jgi:centractin
MKELWRYIFDKLQKSPKEHPILLTEAPLNPFKNRNMMAEIFFEDFGAPKIFFQQQAVLSLYARGQTSGVVLDVGDGVCHCTPVFEGYSISNAIQRIDIGGRDITKHLQLLLRRSGYVFHTTTEFEIVRKIKEQ